MPDKIIEILGFVLGNTAVIGGKRKHDTIAGVFVPKILHMIAILAIMMYGMKFAMSYMHNDVEELKCWKKEHEKEYADMRIADAKMQQDIVNQYREIINRLDILSKTRR